MTGEPSFELIHWLVLGLVLVSELIVVIGALRISGRSENVAMERLTQRFVADIVSRSKRGHSPDWIHYRAEIDRLFETRDERLRVLAAAALAVGLGGTMLALLTTFLVHGGSPISAAGSLIHGMGVALFGSALGVGSHLLIILFLLPRAEKRFELEANDIVDRLYAASEEHPPAEMFTRTLQNELAALRESLNTEFAAAFSTAITGFPQVVERLGTHMDRLAEVVEIQARNSASAMGGIEESACLVRELGEKLEPTTRELASSIQQLLEMPEELGTVLEAGRNKWIDRLHEEQRQQRNELYTQVDLLRATVIEIKAATVDLPERLADGVKGLFSDLGYELRGQLSGHLLELRDDLKSDRDELITTILQEWRNNLGEAVREVLERTSEQVEEKVSGPLQAVAALLATTAETLPLLTERLETAHAEWSRGHSESVAGWLQIADRIEGAAERLAVGDAKLEQAVNALAAAASQLERVAGATGDFEQALRGSVMEVADRHYRDIRPLHQEIESMVDEIKVSRSQFDGILAEQSVFIRRLLHQIVGGDATRAVQSEPS